MTQRSLFAELKVYEEILSKLSVLRFDAKMYLEFLLPDLLNVSLAKGNDELHSRHFFKTMDMRNWILALLLLVVKI